MAQAQLQSLDAEGWEQSDFPILCEDCLGDNPYLRMTKLPYGKQCKMCTRPFTVFKWNPGKNRRFKETQVCITCAKLKNICQNCIKDLDLGVDMRTRDQALQVKDQIAKSDYNREFYIRNAEEKMEKTKEEIQLGTFGRLGGPDRNSLKKLVHSEPYQKFNRPHLCPLFAKGLCEKGDQCQFLHDEKLIKKGLPLPEDPHLKTLFVHGISDAIQDEHIRNFYEGVERVQWARSKNSCFIFFRTRLEAEQAAEKVHGSFITLQGEKLKVQWAVKKQQQQQQQSNQQQQQYKEEKKSVLPPPPGTVQVVYPSQKK